LVEFANTPNEVATDASLRELLGRLGTRLNGALAVLTGRSVADADRILRGAVACIGGLHGAELRDGQGQIRRTKPTPISWPDARAAIERSVSAGTIMAKLEDKGEALALHYRHAPENADGVMTAVQAIADSHQLRVIHGKMVSEILPYGSSKGTAVRTLMGVSPFAGRVPVAIGDDITDEDAFAVANELGGHSILVGNPRPSAARYNIQNVDAVRKWLSAAAIE